MRRPSRQGLLPACTFCTSALTGLFYSANSDQPFAAFLRTWANTTSSYVDIPNPAAAVLPCLKLLGHQN